MGLTYIKIYIYIHQIEKSNENGKMDGMYGMNGMYGSIECMIYISFASLYYGT